MSGENNTLKNTRMSKEYAKRIKPNEKLAFDSKLLFSFIDHFPDSIYFKDRDSKYLRVNRVHARNMGLKSPEEAIGKTDFDFHSEEYAREAYAEEQEIIKTGKALVGKIEKVVDKRGNPFWVFTTKAPIIDEEGKVIGIVGISRNISKHISRDVNEHIKLEKRLEESEEMYKRLFENVAEGIFTVDLENRITAINPAGATLLGFNSPEEILEAGIKMVDVYVHFGEWEEILKSFQGASVINSVSQFKRKDGSEIWVELSYSVLKNDDGSIYSYEGIFEDVTEKVNMEKRLRSLAYRLNALSPGGFYLSKSHERCLKAYADLTMHRIPGLCIIREDPEALLEKYDIKAEEIKLLSTRSVKGFQALSSLQEVSIAVSQFVEANPMSIVLLDGLEYLITRFGFENVYKFVQGKRFDFLETGSVLLIPFDTDTLTQKERALLLSEIKVLQ